MKHFEKSWLSPLSGRKKFTAFNLSYSLSKLLDRKKYEVVNESYIDLHDLESEQPDIIIYDINADYKPALLIELTDHEGLDSTIRTMEIVSNLYHVPESFVFDFDKQNWYRVNGSNVLPTSSSEKFGLNLQSILSNSLMKYSL